MRQVHFQRINSLLTIWAIVVCGLAIARLTLDGGDGRPVDWLSRPVHDISIHATYQQAVAELGRAAQVPVTIETPAPAKACNAMVSVSFHDITLGAALNALGQDSGIWADRDGVHVELWDEPVVLQVYDVHDLLEQGIVGGADQKGGLDDLARKLESAGAGGFGSWKVCGPGSIAIMAPRSCHREMESLLRCIRALPPDIGGGK